MKNSYKSEEKVEYLEGFSVQTKLSYRHKTNVNIKNREKYLFASLSLKVLPGGSLARKISGEKGCYFCMGYASLKNKTWLYGTMVFN